MAKRRTSAKRIQLEADLAAFAAKMKAADRTASYIAETCQYVRVIAAHSSWSFVTDITADGVEGFAAKLTQEKRSARTVAAYKTAIKSFTRWLAQTERLAHDPLTYLKKPSADTDRRVHRRMLLPDEWPWLSRATLAGPLRFGMPPAERHLLYAVAIQTGLRSTELRTLTMDNLRLNATPPFIAYPTRSGSGSIDKQYINVKLAEELAWLAAARRDLFVMPIRTDVADMLRADLAQARADWLATKPVKPSKFFLAPKDEAGGVLDFQALRFTCGAWLAMNGNPPTAIQRVMRHRTLEQTLRAFGHLFRDEALDAIATLPVC